MATARRLASKIFPNTLLSKEGSENLPCRSQRLLNRRRLIDGCHPGAYTLNPNLLRVVRKLERLVDRQMERVGAQKIQMPSLSSAKLWKHTGRYDDIGKELFKLSDRTSSEMCLAPTHEEVVCSIVASHQISFKTLPLLLYQITNKFRDEAHPKNALLRGREFIMKDLYTFDENKSKAMETYQAIIECYENLFIELSLDAVKVQADTGLIGGTKSHEFHLLSDIGEDNLSVCEKCGAALNSELQNHNKPDSCVSSSPNCGYEFKSVKGIELAHSFLLGERYSQPLDVTYRNQQNKPVLAYMGCYGIGITRLVAAAIEVLSTDDQLKLPRIIAPYSLVIIPQKKGHRCEETFHLACDLYDAVDKPLGGDVVLDDRLQLSIGQRIREAKLQGYPLAICLGRKALSEPGSSHDALVEVIDLYDGTSELLPIDAAEELVLQKAIQPPATIV